LRAGDKLAMQALFSRHRTLVYRWLLRFVGNETNAEDLLSEVFLEVWRQADRFEGRSSVPTWLISIARFKALSARRRRTEAELDKKIETTVPDTANDPEAALQEKNRGELLRQALSRLSLEHREIIRCNREDPNVLSAEEIGRVGQGRLRGRIVCIAEAFIASAHRSCAPGLSDQADQPARGQ
jgi:RNA polymerase sigma factor (sigma-70 family)